MPLNRDQEDFDAGRPLRYHTPDIKREKKLADKKKEIAGKMKERFEKNKKQSPWMARDKKTNRQRERRWEQKARESLNIPKGEKNEGNKMYEGKNENNRQ